MSTFQVVGYLDVFAAVARLHKLSASACFPLPVSDDWASGNALVDVVLNGVKARERTSDLFAEAQVTRLTAGSFTWSKPCAGRRFIIPLVTNPEVFHYSGPNSAHLGVGSVWWVDPSVPAGAANNSTYPAYHLYVRVDAHADVPVGAVGRPS